jgi:uncharacterized protein (DUF2267 family)
MTRQQFLAAVRTEGRLGSAREAERWARAVVAALSHLAPDAETRRQFLTQLPGFLKRPLLAEPPRGLLMDREALVQHVGAALDVHAPDAERALRTVWRVVRRAIAPGELTDFQERLPRDVAAFLASLD